MSYQLYDVNGYVGDLASTGGLADLREWLQNTNGGAGELLKGLMREGAVLLSEKLFDELGNLESPGGSLGQTFDNLKSLIDQCTDVAIINNGLEGD